jgi:hypothetical protein
MDADGNFVTATGGQSWDPEGAVTYRSRAAARAAAKGKGLRLVQLLSVAQWEARYPAVGAAA